MYVQFVPVKRKLLNIKEIKSIHNMDKLRLWFKKSKRRYTLDESLINDSDTDIINDKILLISLRMREIEEETCLMKNESVKNKKSIRKLQLLLNEKEDIIKELQEKLD